MAKVQSISDIYIDRSYYARALNLGTKPDGSRWRVIIRAKTKSGLATKLAERLKELEDGSYRPGTTPTVGSWFDYWVENIAAKRVRPNVLANYRSYGRNHIKHIKGRKLDELTPADVRHMEKMIRKHGGSGRTSQAVHNTLSGALKSAMREGIIQRNVCDLVDAPKDDSTPRDAYSRAEAEALLKALATMPAAVESRWLSRLLNGVRQAECLGLEWERVNLDDAVLDISWQLQRIPWKHGDNCGCAKNVTNARCPQKQPAVPDGYEYRPCYMGKHFVRPKTTTSMRIMPMAGRLADVMKRHYETSDKTGLVWKDAKGRPIDVADDNAEWYRICDVAGVRKLVPHSARHTMVSILLDQGVSPEVIRQIAGHSTVLSTRNYMHLSQDSARTALESWG